MAGACRLGSRCPRQRRKGCAPRALGCPCTRPHPRPPTPLPLPAFRNVVRRVIVECALDEAGAAPLTHLPVDPGVRLARMSLTDVVREVREEEAVWFDGIDWGERRRNARAAVRWSA
ncbi:hypothetical protein B0H11DRAFT_1242254 [Mycena galericulata]|nr:hypothetical protein B0H11DRAFT_1242254 [Mycena galericulata]